MEDFEDQSLREVCEVENSMSMTRAVVQFYWSTKTVRTLRARGLHYGQL